MIEQYLPYNNETATVAERIKMPKRGGELSFSKN
jgi:hypothetical protein